MSELNKKTKKSVNIGNCPQGKGMVTSQNSEKCQRFVKEVFLKGEIMERSPLPQDIRDRFDLMLEEERQARIRAKLLTKNLRIG